MAMNPYSNPPAVAAGGEGGGAENAADLLVSAGNFNGILSEADVNVQVALDTLDNHSHEESNSTVVASGVPTASGNFNGILSESDGDVQAALQTIDQHNHNHSHDADDVSFSPYGNIEASTVQIAIQELDDEKVSSEDSDYGILTGGISSDADSLHTHNSLGSVGCTGGIDWSNIISASGYVMSAGNGYHLNPSGDMGVNLPASPSGGNVIGVCDSYAMATTYNLFVLRNGQLIAGLEEDLQIDTNNSGFKLCFIGDTRGWVVIDNI